MNRRTFINWTWLASFAALLFPGWGKYGKASQRAIAASHNGIISLKRTPWLLGCKVYVNGQLIERVQMVNTTKGFVLALGKPGKTRFHTRRIYGWIDIDDSDCMNQSVCVDTRKHSVVEESA